MGKLEFLFFAAAVLLPWGLAAAAGKGMSCVVGCDKRLPLLPLFVLQRPGQTIQR